jgi:hypothetical protein
MIEVVHTTETSANFHQTAWYNVPEVAAVSTSNVTLEQDSSSYTFHLLSSVLLHPPERWVGK